MESTKNQINTHDLASGDILSPCGLGERLVNLSGSELLLQGFGLDPHSNKLDGELGQMEILEASDTAGDSSRRSIDENLNVQTSKAVQNNEKKLLKKSFVC